MFFVSWPAFSADLNGYTAQYENLIGTPPPCSTIISSVDDANWSKLNNSSYRVICIEPGDYSAKGVITLNASGTNGDKRWLRYFQSSDNSDDPWKQSSTMRAKLRGIRLDGASHWILHRLTVDGDGAGHEGIVLSSFSGVNNVIIDHVLIEAFNSSLVEMGHGNSNITIQNSVLRSTSFRTDGGENQCVELGAASGVRIVNNEIYDCNKSISSGSGNPTILDAKIENNDLYVSPAIYSDCSGQLTPGNLNSPCAANEAIISLKSGGSASQPVEILHNRLWGARSGDGNLIGSGSVGEATGISISSHFDFAADYVLVKNNLIWDMQAGISNWWGIPDHDSIIGNIIFDIKQRDPRFSAYAMRLNRTDNIEVYLNTIVNADQTWLELGGEVDNGDFRCNVIINSGAKSGSSPTSTTQADYNAFYGTPVFSANAGNNNIVRSSASESGTFEYCFYRKLRTGAERVCAPFTRATTSSPHYRACDPNLGSRSDIGINDARP